MQIKKKNIGVI